MALAVAEEKVAFLVQVADVAGGHEIAPVQCPSIRLAVQVGEVGEALMAAGDFADAPGRQGLPFLGQYNQLCAGQHPADSPGFTTRVLRCG
ncbi:hypothetical protein D3C85_1637960 [compost metagenome]